MRLSKTLLLAVLLFAPGVVLADATYPEWVKAVSEVDVAAIQAAPKSEIQAARDTSRRPLLSVAVFQADLFSTEPVKARPYYDMIDLLIEKGADVNAVDGNGDSALHEAAKYCETESILRLRRGWANVSLKDRKGYTPADIVQKQIDFYQAQMKEAKGESLAYIKDKLARCGKAAEYLKSPQNQISGTRSTPSASSKTSIQPGSVPANPRTPTNSSGDAAH